MRNIKDIQKIKNFKSHYFRISLKLKTVKNKETKQMLENKLKLIKEEINNLGGFI